RADCVVMSTHGRSGLERLLYGSVAEQVLHDAEIPLVMIPARSHTSWAGPDARRVLVPLDGSQSSEAALEPAVGLASRIGASLLLLRVVQPVDGVGLGYEAYLPDRLAATEEHARQSLEALARPLRARGVSVEVRTAI